MLLEQRENPRIRRSPGKHAAKPPKQSFIYAMRAEDHGLSFVKFGRSKQPDVRRGKLQVDHGVDLELVGTVKGAAPLEGLIHACLDDYRVFGEWYHHNGWAKSIAGLIERGNSALLYKYLDKISALV